MASLGIPFMDDEFWKYFSFASKYSDLQKVYESVKNYSSFLNEDEYSLLIIHDTVQSEWTNQRGIWERILNVN